MIRHLSHACKLFLHNADSYLSHQTGMLSWHPCMHHKLHFLHQSNYSLKPLIQHTKNVDMLFLHNADNYLSHRTGMLSWHLCNHHIPQTQQSCSLPKLGLKEKLSKQ